VSDAFALVVGRFYEDLGKRLEAGARLVLEEAGASQIDVFDVPGAYELPLAAKLAAESGRYAAVVCLGAVIRGETDRGIQAVQLETLVPCGFGVLTVDTMEQAIARAGGDTRDSGRHAAEAVLATLAVKRELAGRKARPGF